MKSQGEWRAALILGAFLTAFLHSVYWNLEMYARLNCIIVPKFRLEHQSDNSQLSH